MMIDLVQELRAFVWRAKFEQVVEGVDRELDNKMNWVGEGMASTKEAITLVFLGGLQEIQHVRWDVSKVFGER